MGPFPVLIFVVALAGFHSVATGYTVDDSEEDLPLRGIAWICKHYCRGEDVSDYESEYSNEYELLRVDENEELNPRFFCKLCKKKKRRKTTTSTTSSSSSSSSTSSSTTTTTMAPNMNNTNNG